MPSSTSHGTSGPVLMPMGATITEPSLAARFRSISTASDRVAPARSKSKPWTSAASMAFSIVHVMDACADTSIHCGAPVRRALVSPISAASAASAPVWRHTWGTEIFTGARSRIPCRLIGPPRAASVISVHGWSTRGPSDPNGVTRTCTSSGLAAVSSASSIPAAAAWPGGPLSMTISAPATRSRKAARSASLPARSSTIDRLLSL